MSLISVCLHAGGKVKVLLGLGLNGLNFPQAPIGEAQGLSDKLACLEVGQKGRERSGA